VFIVILGGRSMAEIQDWYHAHLGVARAPEIPSKISVLADAYGDSPDTLYTIAALPLHGQAFIEADAMPAGVAPRPCVPGELPPAIAIVTFEVDVLPSGVDWITAPRTHAGAPYAGRRAGTCVGPAGELVELVEARR
jgi:hypothetical protein